MAATPPSKGKLLYHITHIDNIQSILEHGLLSRKELIDRGMIDFVDIADPGILSKREEYRESLSQYVLFHFYAKNPFDCAVCRKYGAKNMVIITLERNLSQKNKFMIIPSHPLDRSEPQIYPYSEGLVKIRWDILDRSEGRDYDDPDIRKACMAECIMDYVIPSKAFCQVYVYDENAKNMITAMRNSQSIRIQVAPYMFP